jgi:hypothetical protein
MNLQTFIVVSAAGLSAYHFIRGAIQELSAPAEGGTCGKCSSGGCPVARKI